PEAQVLPRRFGRGLGRALGGLGDGLHGRLLAASSRDQLAARVRGGELADRSKISFRRCGVTGSCVTAPDIPMALSIADAIAAPTPVMPLSPAPLMPSGLSGLIKSSRKIT